MDKGRLLSFTALYLHLRWTSKLTALSGSWSPEILHRARGILPQSSGIQERSADRNSPLGRFLGSFPRNKGIYLAVLHLDTLGGNAANFCLALIFTLRRGDQMPNLCCLVPHLPWSPLFPFLLMPLQQCWQLVSQDCEGFLCGKAQTWGHLILRWQKNKQVSVSLFSF